MKNAEFKDLLLFITGPTYIRPEIREAGTYCEFGHRDKVAKVKVESILKNLRKIAGVNDDYEVCLISGLEKSNRTSECCSSGGFQKLWSILPSPT
jgi:aspartate aminotransferase-like enzyme